MLETAAGAPVASPPRTSNQPRLPCTTPVHRLQPTATHAEPPRRRNSMKHVRAVLVTATFLAALPFGAGAEEPQKVTIDTSGWFILTSYFNNGPLNAGDLPRWALSKD